MGQLQHCIPDAFSDGVEGRLRAEVRVLCVVRGMVPSRKWARRDLVRDRDTLGAHPGLRSFVDYQICVGFCGLPNLCRV